MAVSVNVTARAAAMTEAVSRHTAARTRQDPDRGSFGPIDPPGLAGSHRSSITGGLKGAATRRAVPSVEKRLSPDRLGLFASGAAPLPDGKLKRESPGRQEGLRSALQIVFSRRKETLP